MTDELLTIRDAAAALRDGTVTSVALVEAGIDRADRLDDELGVYIRRMDDTALAAAAQADADFAAGVDRGPLQGIPMGIKDILSTDDAPTTGQSLILDPVWGDQGDGPVVKRLRDAGAIIVGKTSTMEFAIGLPDERKPFPVPRNPWNSEHWTGGSSSGTGSGVATGMFLGGIGTDTGGSIRSPSAWNGISGIKATYGRVPKNGCTQNGFSLDHIGPMARSSWDCAAMLQVIAGHDPGDATSARHPVPDYLSMLDGSLEGVRVGVERAYHLDPETVEPGVLSLFEESLDTLRSLGATIVEFTLPEHYPLYSVAMGQISAGEMFAYHHANLQERWEDYGRWTRMSTSRAFLLGAADFAQAQRVRTVALREMQEAMAEVDVVVTPSHPGPAPLVEGLTFESFWLKRVNFTSLWNFIGLPAISVPMGLVDGLPVGLQIAGHGWQEGQVMRVGDAFQRVTDWHLMVPDCAAVAA